MGQRLSASPVPGVGLRNLTRTKASSESLSLQFSVLGRRDAGRPNRLDLCSIQLRCGRHFELSEVPVIHNPRDHNGCIVPLVGVGRFVVADTVTFPKLLSAGLDADRCGVGQCQAHISLPV